jgi:hypothetical protein
LIFPVVPYVLDIIVILKRLKNKIHLFAVFLVVKSYVICGYALDLSGNKCVLFSLCIINFKVCMLPFRTVLKASLTISIA